MKKTIWIFRTKKMTWMKKSSKKRKCRMMYDAHETIWKKHKNVQSTKLLKIRKQFDEFWNILKQLNVSNVNFESTMNDLKQISIVWKLFLTSFCWFETMKSNDFDYLIKRFEIDLERRNQSNTFLDEWFLFFSNSCENHLSII